MSNVERMAVDMWVAAADAAVKGGAEPPANGWDGLDEDLKRYYLGLAGAKYRARRGEHIALA